MSLPESSMVRGLAIFLMLAHHLFAFPDSYVGAHPELGKFSPWYQLGVFGQLCVSLFLFLAGYGCGVKNAGNLSGAISRRFYRFYRVALPHMVVLVLSTLVFKPEGWASFGNNHVITYHYDFWAVVKAFTFWDLGFSYEWWFGHVYFICLLAAWPLCEKLAALGWRLLALLSLLAIVANKIGGLRFSYNVLFWQSSFVLGFIIARFHFEKVLYIFDKVRAGMRVKVAVAVLAWALLLVARKVTGAVLDALAAAILVGIILQVCSASGLLSKTLVFLGRHSTGMWLNSTFLCFYYFNDWFSNNYSPFLGLFVVVAGSLALSVAVDYAAEKVFSAFGRMAACFPKPRQSV